MTHECYIPQRQLPNHHPLPAISRGMHILVYRAMPDYASHDDRSRGHVSATRYVALY